MTAQEKLNKIKGFLEEYQGNDHIFTVPENETEQQQQFREDLYGVVSIVFDQNVKIPEHLSSAEIRERLRAIWKHTKPESMK